MYSLFVRHSALEELVPACLCTSTCGGGQGTIPNTEGAPEGLIPRSKERNLDPGLALGFIAVIRENPYKADLLCNSNPRKYPSRNLLPYPVKGILYRT